MDHDGIGVRDRLDRRPAINADAKRGDLCDLITTVGRMAVMMKARH